MARHYGAGTLWVTPKTDALGAVLAVPTPFQLGVLQDVSFDVEFEQKLLYGQSQYPIDWARGKGKIGIKAKNAEINFLPFSAMFLGQSATDGLYDAFVDDAGVIIPAGGVITVVPPNGGTFFATAAVRSDINGTPLIRVLANPATGQYTVDNTGKFTFAAADVGNTVYIDFMYSGATGGKIISAANLRMGAVPSFKLTLSMRRNGRTLTLEFPRCSSKKLGMSLKQEDFLIPEFDMEAIADEVTGSPYRWSMS